MLAKTMESVNTKNLQPVIESNVKHKQPKAAATATATLKLEVAGVHQIKLENVVHASGSSAANKARA